MTDKLTIIKRGHVPHHGSDREFTEDVLETTKGEAFLIVPDDWEIHVNTQPTDEEEWEKWSHTDNFAKWVNEGIKTSKEFEQWLRGTITQKLMDEIKENRQKQPHRGWLAEIADLNMYANVFPDEDDSNERS